MDFTPFEEMGWIRADNNKYLIYTSFHPSYPDYLYFSCDMEYQKLKPYLDSPDIDILVLIKCAKKDTLALQDYLKSDRWCYDKYVITHKTPELFKGFMGASYLFDKNGKVIALTNPSLPNFKKLMEPYRGNNSTKE